MARNRKGAPHQAKHFQPEDHAHAAHQEEASRGHAQLRPPRQGSRKGPGAKDQPSDGSHAERA